ncbi:heme utilization cystosolic carrier protein HutX [Utexia brackfieldae]|uniref:heme utilization cystosolic carrier protein HutX n=1 Tax=Utexia brackfieldae TaxID=3074108 RepID=UPI00370DA8F4
MSSPSLTEFMATHPDGTLESIAQDYQVSLLTVIQAMPENNIIAGDHFDQVWDAVVNWGEITILVNTNDIIFEFQGHLPTGYHRHGYFNLRGKAGLSGHIKAEHCQSIAFVERKFMGTDTAAILFLNLAGQAMFKIFVGRDEHRQLQVAQLAAFRELASLTQAKG